MLGFVHASSIFAVAVAVVFVIYLSLGDGVIGICGYLRRKKKGVEEKEALIDGIDNEEHCEISVEEEKRYSREEIKRIDCNSTFIEEEK